MRNQRLLDNKWRAWRRSFEAEVRMRRPRWEQILDAQQERFATGFNLSFFDHRDRPFPAQPGRNAEDVFDSTIVSYVKWRLDRAAHRHRYLCEERANASRFRAEAPDVTPWLPRNGYSVRWRKSFGGLIAVPEVRYEHDNDTTIYGSPEEKNAVLAEQVRPEP